MVHFPWCDLGANPQAAAQDARFESGNGLVNDALQCADINVRGAVTGQCRQAIVDYRVAGLGVERGGSIEQ
ncbi:hypothetical protein D3C75_1220710 [compost metagenome]